MKLPRLAMRFEFPKGVAVDACVCGLMQIIAFRNLILMEILEKEWGEEGSDKAEFKFPKGNSSGCFRLLVCSR
ncbi:MAG: hypothetical protein P0116_13525 [Candidatus Nitrosocosmicus sp.]|nr:hypothetical protein [Candidatus Nitrosocosmicus sp.]